MDHLDKKTAEYFVGRFGKDALDSSTPIEKNQSNKVELIYNSDFSKKDLPLPEITCVCPTYGRFTWLQNSVACFLLQDYPNKRMLICNDHEVRINDGFLPPNIEVVNCPKRFNTLGDKRQFMLEYAKTEIVAHWDDDDIYLPWHLLWTARHFKSHSGSKMLRLHPALFVEVESSEVVIKEVCDWEHEAMDVFDRKMAISIGGYDKTNLQEAVALQGRFMGNNAFSRINAPIWMYSFLYNRFDRTKHLCQAGDGNEQSYVRCGNRNSDHGNFKPIIKDWNNPTKWARQHLCGLISSYLVGAKRKWGEVAHRHLKAKFDFGFFG
jgi:hypothetical protein